VIVVTKQEVSCRHNIEDNINIFNLLIKI